MRRCRAISFMLLLVAEISLGINSPAMQDGIKKKRSELQKLKKEINTYEKKIHDREKKERATLELLDSYDRQAILLRKLVANLHQQAQSLQTDIDSTRQSVSRLNSQLSFLKQHYAHYVSTVYRYGETYDLELLLSSKSLNQMLIRSEYLKRFSDQRKTDLERIGARRNQYIEQTNLLQRQLAEQRDLLAEKASEEKNLLKKSNRRKSVLAEIRRDKKSFKQEMGRKLEAAREIEQLVAKLVEEDRARKLREPKHSENGSVPRSPRESSGTGFEALRGRYRWPVAGGRIVGRFGSRENPTLHTVTQNTGIDINVPDGTPVEAIAEGQVSTIWWLPSFGNLVIVNHNNGFRTVYAHLSEIFVNEGEAVAEGEKLGRSGEALSGPLFHFELWKDREKQDPEQWLRPHGLTQK